MSIPIVVESSTKDYSHTDEMNCKFISLVLRDTRTFRVRLHFEEDCESVTCSFIQENHNRQTYMTTN